MKSNGFTLVELLATIVILFIILIMTVSFLKGTNSNQCFYEYTDSKGNSGCSNYCGMENGNLYCNTENGFGRISVIKFNERR